MAATCASRGCAVAELPPVPRVGSWIRIPDGDEGRVEGTMGHDDSPETSIYVRWRSGSARTLLLSEPFEVLGTEEPAIHLAEGQGARIEVRFPEGTPEYAAYRAELTEELGKFARGEEPYPYEPKTTADLNVPPERAAEQAAFYEHAVAIARGEQDSEPVDLDTATREFIEWLEELGIEPDAAQKAVLSYALAVREADLVEGTD